MKKQIIISVVLMVISCLSNQLIAQETITKQKTKSNNTNERDGSTNQWPILAVKISPTENGCSIVFDNAILSPRDAASGMSTGKRTHKPIRFDVNPTDNTIVEVKNSSDLASSQAKGKSSSEPTAIISKGTYNWIKNSFDKGYKQSVKNTPIENGEFSLPADCDDGNYDLEISFTYQKIEMNNNEKVNSKSYVSGHFIIEIDGGVCRSIKEKGVR